MEILIRILWKLVEGSYGTSYKDPMELLEGSYGSSILLLSCLCPPKDRGGTLLSGLQVYSASTCSSTEAGAGAVAPPGAEKHRPTGSRS